MPPCFDIYILVSPDDRSAILARFVDRYVNLVDPGEPRFDAFMRTFVTEEPRPEDAEALDELRFDPHASSAFTVYLSATSFHGSIIALTEEGDLVLGLSLDDPMNDPAVWSHGEEMLNSLMTEFGAATGIGGVKLPPPHSRAEWTEWNEDDLVMIRRDRS